MQQIDVLVVDDEEEIADLVTLYLQNEGYVVHKYVTGDAAKKAIQEQNFDLAVLDVMLPDIDGIELLKMIRKSYFYPVIMLTAKVEDIDKITGLTLGADDYITKPFNPLELTARVKTQLRRYKRYNTSNIINEQNEHDFHGIYINKDTHECSLNGTALRLTPIEFSIVWYLAENKGKVVASEELFEAVWGEKYLDNNNTVMAHIGRLREKMKDGARNPKYIKTVWGVGYRLE